MADVKPYTEAESFFADASYYKGFSEKTGNNDEKKALKGSRSTNANEEKAESSRTIETKKKFYFVPKHLRQPGQPPLTLLSTEQLKILQS
ncbi:hypothetical protein PJI17_31045, partial [Mycobacterium kansasii]